jgi:hypothetical protein
MILKFFPEAGIPRKVPEGVLDPSPRTIRPRRYVFQFGRYRQDVSQIEIRALGKGAEFRPDVFDALAERAAR